MRHRIGAIVTTVPRDDREWCGYWHVHLPLAQTFIDSQSTPRSVRRLCIQSLVDPAARLRESQRHRSTRCRVVAAVSLPLLFDSQLIVFFGDEYWNQFFRRDTPEQRWIALAPTRSLAREWGVLLPDGFEERGYAESIADEGFQSEGERWFLGDVE
jgi:hypothetical protein